MKSKKIQNKNQSNEETRKKTRMGGVCVCVCAFFTINFEQSNESDALFKMLY